jgi:hypothetical protein
MGLHMTHRWLSILVSVLAAGAAVAGTCPPIEGLDDDLLVPGRVLLLGEMHGTEESPAHIDFAIEDCRCDYKGQTSTGIYYWKDDSFVIAAPRPGSGRPPRFNERNGEMMELKRLPED